MFVVHYTYCTELCTELCTVLLLLVRGNESTVVLSLQGLLEKGGGGISILYKLFSLFSLQGLLSMERVCLSLQGLLSMEIICLSQGLFFMDNSLF